MKWTDAHPCSSRGDGRTGARRASDFEAASAARSNQSNIHLGYRVQDKKVNH
jgi:hypothetical protein